MFEHHKQPLISRREFILRTLRYACLALLLVAISLGIGILGYRYFENLPWVDAILNAAMILGGMGPVNQLQTQGGKLFASFYALFSGIVFLFSVGVLLAPIIHRILHRFHLQNNTD
jgi:hypothetical protein